MILLSLISCIKYNKSPHFLVSCNFLSEAHVPWVYPFHRFSSQLELNTLGCWPYSYTSPKQNQFNLCHSSCNSFMPHIFKVKITNKILHSRNKIFCCKIFNIKSLKVQFENNIDNKLKMLNIHHLSNLELN